MPVYEYVCTTCKKAFELLLTGSEKPACPHCGKKKVEKQFSTFAVGDAASAEPMAPPGCHGCGENRGPGSCPGMN